MVTFEQTQTIMRSYGLDVLALDSVSEAIPITPVRMSPEDAQRWRSVYKLELRLKKKGYQLNINSNCYRGLPVQLLLVDNNAPLFWGPEYDKKLDERVLEVTKTLNLPYFPVTTFFNMAIRRL